jgi:hypothetical protein
MAVHVKELIFNRRTSTIDNDDFHAIHFAANVGKKSYLPCKKTFFMSRAWISENFHLLLSLIFKPNNNLNN